MVLAVVRVVVALLPVLLFLGALILMDSFKLVRLRAVVQAIGAGGLAALVAALTNGYLLDHAGLDVREYSRYVAPIVEELLKAAWIVFVIRRGRVAFLVDAAIVGFAVGAGFALVENLDYLSHLGSASLSLWFSRGFGTAVLHGATTGTVAVISKAFYDRRAGLAAFFPGLLAAILIHSLYNHFVATLSPILSTLILLATLPIVLMFVFDRGEKATRSWLAGEFDGEVEMLQQILAGQVADTRTGAYLESLKSRFEGTVVADMLCLLQIQIELKVRAKGMLMAREAGLEMPIGDDVRANLSEMRYLESQIGRTGLLAMRPIMSLDARDIWQFSMMEEAGRSSVA